MPWGVLSGVETGIGIPIDSNGNFTTDGTKTYEWDAENRLTRVTQGVTELARFTYDGKGRRVQKIVGGVTRSYIYDGANIIEERLSSGQTYDYVQGPGIDQPLAVRDQASVVSYYLADHLGSIVQTTNSLGAVTFTREYDPWGNPIQGSATSGYAFTGREWDPETGLYYFRARYLDPKLGRFLSEDPIGVAAGLNLYAYVENNPVRLRDPLGLAPMSLPDLVTNYYCAFTYANDPAGMAACLTNAQKPHPPPGSVPLIGCGVLTAVRIPTNITFRGASVWPVDSYTARINGGACSRKRHHLLHARGRTDPHHGTNPSGRTLPVSEWLRPGSGA
jgi:RHS repeat-associated protein